MKKLAIHSVPRSGSSWLGELLNSHPQVAYRFQPFFSYAFKNRIHLQSTAEEIQLFFEDLLTTNDDFIHQTDNRKAGKLPLFQKDPKPSHLVYKEVRYHYLLPHLLQSDPELKAIGLVRNPLEVLSSWYHAPKEFRKDLGWDILQEWQYAPSKNLNKPEEYNGYEKWKEVTSLFLQLECDFQNRFVVVTYSDLIQSTTKTCQQLFSFIGLPWTQSTVDFVDSSAHTHHQDPYAVFRNQSTARSDTSSLPETIKAAILQDLADSPLAKYLQ